MTGARLRLIFKPRLDLHAATTGRSPAPSGTTALPKGPVQHERHPAPARPARRTHRAVRHAAPRLSQDGSVVLMSGAASVRPAGPAPAYVACNAAIEGLGRGLAVELAPIRVNVVSPGMIDGNLWSGRPADIREQAATHYREAALLNRLGTEPEVAETVLFLFTNGYMTGSTLYPDGGYALR
ncbi:SDR family oxidoreductase [Streptomyces sp. NRRL F-5755]|uniref:SDR family oxidoreductase n=1 Tax=Streptomyces sp. NRRL F-5755 TaxID=1519475 RepID=UPI002277172A|nr:SDR family oxidoreductase [Streptomyces sp. NRRL F-5755]